MASLSVLILEQNKQEADFGTSANNCSTAIKMQF